MAKFFSKDHRQFGFSVLSGLLLGYLVVIIFGLVIQQIRDLIYIILFSLAVSLPIAIAVFFLGYYFFHWLMRHIQAIYFIRVMTATFFTSVIFAILAALPISFIILGKMGIKEMIFSFAVIGIPVIISGSISGLCYWLQTRVSLQSTSSI